VGLVGGHLVVSAAQVLHEGVARREYPSPVIVLIPRMGRSRRFSCAWSASTRLFAYRSTWCHAAGTT
jgi:hypothetical protein